MIKSLRVVVLVDIRADEDDEDAVREATKERLQEAIDDDTLNMSVEESEEDLEN